MSDQNGNYPSLGDGLDILKTFQLSSDVKWKSDIKVGHRIARNIQSTLGGNTSYYFVRNSRIAKNRSMVAGRYDMSRFMDRLQMNSKFNYVNISWLPFHIVSTIVARKVGSWMNRNEKIVVNAVDAESEKIKRMRYEEIEYYLDQKERLEELQKQSGVQMIPKVNVPLDRDELDLWATENRLPEEIKYETGTNGLLAQEGLFDVLKERELRDSAITGLVGLYTWMDEKGVIHNEYVKPEDSIYSYSEFPDFRDTTWRGRIVSRKISEIRRKYGRQFGGKMTEEEIWLLAQTAKEYQVPDKIRWINDWAYSTLRPYDEWNIDCIEFAFKSLDADGFNMKVTRSGTLIMDQGSDKTKSQSTYQGYIPDDGWNMYWGVYARTADKMLEWGLMKNQIKAQDIKEIGNVEFPFSFYMYQNEDMRNLAIPEKVEKPFEQMCLILLQMEKLITRYKPPGAKVNVSAIRELDLGLADLQKPLDLEKHYEQTGIYYYTDTDAEGNRINEPITELANAGFRENALGLREMYMFWYQTLKDELGEDPNLVQQAVQPRVTEGNVETSIQQADNATDYMFDAYKYIVTEAARKTACLMHDSVSFGAKVYRHIIGEDEVKGRVFSTQVKMLPTEKQIAELQLMVNNAITSTPDILMYMNTFKIMRIAKEDTKLAEEYFRLAMKRMLQSKIDQARENQMITFQGQEQSGKAIEKEKRKSLVLELKTKAFISDKETKNALKIATVNQILALRAKGIELPSQWISVENEIIRNLELPLFSENIDQTDALIMQQIEGGAEQEDESEEQESQQQNLQPT